MLSRRFLLAFLPLFLMGCRPGTAPVSGPVAAAPGSTKVQNDDLGRPIAVKGEVKRLIVIGPGAIETVFALGAGQKLVGRDSWAHFPAAAKKLTVAGDFQGPSVEECVALHPDLIIVQGETYDKGRVESWQKQIGAPVAALNATNIKAVQKDFLKIGAWVGQPARAAALAKTLDESGGKPTVSAFIEVGRSPLYTAGAGTLVADAVRAGGFSNVADDVKGYQPFGLESLLARQPAVYIVPSETGGNGTDAALLNQLRATPALSKLKCIQAGRVLGINGDFLLQPSPRLKLGIDQLKREAQLLNGAAPLKK